MENLSMLGKTVIYVLTQEDANKINETQEKQAPYRAFERDCYPMIIVASYGNNVVSGQVMLGFTTYFATNAERADRAPSVDYELVDVVGQWF